jgi:hypothetical protein
MKHHKPKDFKENQWVTCTSSWCSNNAGKRLNTSTITRVGKNATEGFNGWYAFGTVLEACQKNPEYFIILDEVINDYQIY